MKKFNIVLSLLLLAAAPALAQKNKDKGEAVVLPDVGAVRCDVGLRDGRVAGLVERLEAREADRVIDARGKLVLPGAVDSHFHIGIYRDLAVDADVLVGAAAAGRRDGTEKNEGEDPGCSVHGPKIRPSPRAVEDTSRLARGPERA